MMVVVVLMMVMVTMVKNSSGGGDDDGGGDDSGGDDDNGDGDDGNDEEGNDEDFGGDEEDVELEDGVSANHRPTLRYSRPKWGRATRSRSQVRLSSPGSCLLFADGALLSSVTPSCLPRPFFFPLLIGFVFLWFSYCIPLIHCRGFPILK